MKALKLYLTKENSLTVWDLQQDHYQILLTISQKKFIKWLLYCCGCFLEYESVNGHFIKHKFSSCGKDYLNKFDEELKKKFKNVPKFSKNDINKCILLLTKGVYIYKYMDD